MKDVIVAKALKCIDEIYPDENTLNESYFPTDAFIDEAVRWVVDNAPTHLLVEREDVSEPDDFGSKDDGTIRVGLSVNGRIVYVMCEDWHRPVFDLISEQTPLYRQQKNKVLRGNPTRPVVVRLGNAEIGKYTLELYTSSVNNEAKVNIQYVPYSAESIPVNLADITAWKLAEIVLMSMHDVQSASVCASKVNEHLQQLSL